MKSPLAALACVAFLHCSGSQQTPPPTATTQPAVVLMGRDGTTHRVLVEIADTDAERARGLMERSTLDPDKGMLFLFPTDAIHSFWMQNTFIPLDMIFIRADHTIAGVVENAEPMTTTSRRVGQPSRYVLEVNGGWVKQHGIPDDSVVKFENVDVASAR